ncbi:methionyl-tRNA formyltransferase [Gammaproteobacteria bacterium]|nr:methionyl-tRNA formyltransferase [Gammaproteobacteria bacterium]
MKVLICDSKNWFTLQSSFQKKYSTRVISNKEDLTKKTLDDFQPRFIFFVHWNWIVDKEIYENYECIVFHTAPLPYGRGGSPIQNLILKGFDSSPVCGLRMTGKLDAGPIYSQIEVSLDGALNSIFTRICDAVNKMIVEIVEHEPTPRDQEGQTHVFSRLKDTDNEIPHGLSLEQIYDRVRMLDHEDYPSAFILYGNQKLEFSQANITEGSLVMTCKLTNLK